ncbi:GNAT family N-acetyltransferase [Endozoicomonadaceae bacterium StTr2]
MRAHIEFELPALHSSSPRLSLLSSFCLKAHNDQGYLQLMLHDCSSPDQLDISLSEHSPASAAALPLLASMLDYLFARSDQLNRIYLAPSLVQYLNQCGEYDVIRKMNDGEVYAVDRARFYQQGMLWHQTGSQTVENPGKDTLYQRYDFQSDTVITLQKLDTEHQAHVLQQWMGIGRSDHAATSQDCIAYTGNRTAQQQKQVTPLLASFDNEPCCYIETCLAKDAGLAATEKHNGSVSYHALLGDPRFQDDCYSQALARAISHFIFLDNTEVESLQVTPWTQNPELLNLLRPAGWQFVRELEYSNQHKTRTDCNRQEFFNNVRL